ncbi:hypothetical protein GW17_00059461 [Ensete ventricosum]|nr:hypothetical protein GW17_00059461 [Ensete ventricosum]
MGRDGTDDLLSIAADGGIGDGTDREGGVIEGEDEEATSDDERCWLWVGVGEGHDRRLMELEPSWSEGSEEVVAAKEFSTSFTTEEAKERPEWQVAVERSCRERVGKRDSKLVGQMQPKSHPSPWF